MRVHPNTAEAFPHRKWNEVESYAGKALHCVFTRSWGNESFKVLGSNTVQSEGEALQEAIVVHGKTEAGQDPKPLHMQMNETKIHRVSTKSDGDTSLLNPIHLPKTTSSNNADPARSVHESRFRNLYSKDLRHKTGAPESIKIPCPMP